MKIMMFAHNGSLNRGCEAIVRSTAEMLKSSIEDAFIILASGRPNTDKEIRDLDLVFPGGPQKINNSFVNKVRIYTELKVFKSEEFALSQMYKNIVKKIPEVDICLSIGGDNYCYGEQYWLYTIDKKAKKNNKKLVLWGCSIGEEDLSEKKLKDLKNFDLILARESLTYELLKKYNIENLKLCADPAFNLNSIELPLPKGWKTGDTIGLNFSPLVLKRNPKSGEAVKALIAYIMENTTSVIVLTPHVIDKENDDYELLEKYFEEFKETNRVLLLPNNLNAMEYKGYISRMRLFIGARTHATIAAYSSLVPTLVLGYSVKSRGISKDIFGIEKYVLGINHLSNSELLISSFNTLNKEEKLVKGILTKRIPEIKRAALRMADYLKEIS